MLNPKIEIRITGNAPLTAKAYERERLRCNLCGTIFTAPLPAAAGNGKYDEKARAIIPLLRYGSGFPLNRLQNLQQSLGCPFPVANQWKIIAELHRIVSLVHKALTCLAAKGQIIFNDDTVMKILSLLEIKKELYDKQKRSGVFTSGFLSIFNGHKIALFFTGRKHAGENMMELLKQRPDNLNPPIQMCDALSRNLPKEFKTLLAHCLSHARRNFTELILLFPIECTHVIRLLAKVYHNEATIKKEKMSDRKRLLYHKKHSSKTMADLKKYFLMQFKRKNVEPNSSLGKAFTYMLKRWKAFTLFLRKAGAPLDNNICERALKMSILHRNNSLFYKNENGAEIGDAFMSLIHTCKIAGVDPFDYLIELQKNQDKVKAVPDNWLPWNYKKNLVALAA